MTINSEGIASTFELALRRQLARLEGFAAELVVELDTDEGRLETTRMNLERALLMRQRLTSELNRLGFQTTVRSLYGDIATDLEREADGDAAQLALSESALAAFASNMTRNLDNSWFTMTGRIQEIVEAAMLTNAPIGDLVQGLAGPGRASIRLTADLSGSFRQWVNLAGAAVETALASMVRQIQFIEASEAGVRHFIYQGTTISTTRPFCRLMRGVVVTLEDLAAIGNDPAYANIRRLRDKDGRQPPVIPSLGGWRCRHTLITTSLRDAKEDGRVIFARDGDDLNRKAGAML